MIVVLQIDAEKVLVKKDAVVFCLKDTDEMIGFGRNSVKEIYLDDEAYFKKPKEE